MKNGTPETDFDAARADAQQKVRDLRQQISHLDAASVEMILSGARSHYAWKDVPVSERQIHKLYDIVKMGSTSMNGCPARFVFVTTDEGRDRIAKSLKPANIPKVIGAPLTVIIAYDLEFWKHLPQLFPHEDRRHFFEGKEAYSLDTAYRNSTLQGAYLMIAARAMGLDVGPLSGFSNDIIDQEFFAGTTLRSNFLCNVGIADESALFQKLPRFDFDQVCSFA